MGWGEYSMERPTQEDHRHRPSHSGPQLPTGFQQPFPSSNPRQGDRHTITDLDGGLPIAEDLLRETHPTDIASQGRPQMAAVARAIKLRNGKCQPSPAPAKLQMNNSRQAVTPHRWTRRRS